MPVPTNPLEMDQYRPNAGGYSHNASGNLSIPGNSARFLKVDTYTYSGQSMDYFQMQIEGLTNAQYLSFYYSVYDRYGAAIQNETRIRQNNSVQLLQQERTPAGSPVLTWDLDNVIYYFSIRNAGPNVASVEAIWTGGIYGVGPGVPPAPPGTLPPSMVSGTLRGMTLPPPPFRTVVAEEDAIMSVPWQKWITALIEKVDAKVVQADLLDLQSKADNIIQNKANKKPDADPNHFAGFDEDGDLADTGKDIPEGDVVGTTDVQRLTNKAIANMPSVTYVNTGAALTSDHFGKMVKFINGVNDVTCFLPSVGAGDIDSLVSIMRLGTGRLTIRCADSDTVEKSSPGGGIYCIEAGRVAANLSLFLATETKWAILGGTGIWYVF